MYVTIFEKDKIEYVVRLVLCRDGDTSALAGIWLHRQQPDDLSSTDECAFSEEEDFEAAADNVPHLEPSCQFLDRVDIAAFDTLMSMTPDTEPATRSNVELLSMLAVDEMLKGDSIADVRQCDGSACGSVAETEHALWTSDEVDGMNETLVADNNSFSSRPQTGSVIESGSGDLTTSPVHHTAAAAGSIATASFQSVCPSVVKPSSRPWQRDAASSLSTNEETRYIVEAAELISHAQEHEIGENYPAAYSHYRSGIEILVKGVQSTHFI